MGRFKFLARSGKWVSRHLLVVREQESDLSAEYLMDVDFCASIQAHVPEDWLFEFPSGNEIVGQDDPEIKDYLRWVSPAFDAVCRQRRGSTPNYFPKFSGTHVTMPAGWRLVRNLPPDMAARLTMQLLRACTDGKARTAAVTIVHRTRENAYPKVSAPHPIYNCLTETGRILIGNLIVPIRCFSLKLAEACHAANIHGFGELASFFRARDQETELKSYLAWGRSQLTPEWSLAFWKQVFSHVKEQRDRFTDFREIWERAHADGAVPATVPTSDGPIPLSEIYVTTDTSVGHDLDDGRIVLLSAGAAAGWIKAGARPLGSEPVIFFAKRLSEPSQLLDLFPELAAAREIVETADELLAVWVEGLEEQVGPSRRKGTVAMDAGGSLVIDRQRFESCGWGAGMSYCFVAFHAMASSKWGKSNPF